MARRLGVPQSTYSNYENDNREPSFEMINAIAEELQIPAQNLFSIPVQTADEISGGFPTQSAAELAGGLPTQSAAEMAEDAANVTVTDLVNGKMKLILDERDSAYNKFTVERADDMDTAELKETISLLKSSAALIARNLMRL